MTSLVLPTYNPGLGIDRSWHTVREFIRKRSESWEAIFVLDGCTDGTLERLKTLASIAPDSRLRVVSYSPNRGKGFAVRTGLLAANGRYRIFTDVDLQFWDGVERTAAALYSGADVAVASRTHPESRYDFPASFISYAIWRRLQSKAFNVAVRAVLPVRLSDTQAGLKGMSARFAEAVLPKMTIDGFGFDCEWLTVCARLGVPVHQIPLTFRYDTIESTTKPRTVVKILHELLRIRKTWRRAPLDWGLSELPIERRRAA